MIAGAILAAGRGRRLSKVSGGKPKAFVNVLGKPLLSLQAISLKSSGISIILAIVPPLWEAEANAILSKVTNNYLVINNTRSFLENGYSFLLALKYTLAFSNKAVITVVDHLYERKVIEGVLRALNEGAPLVIAGDKRPEYIDVSEATKIKKINDQLVVSKELSDWDWIDMGIFGVTRETMKYINKCITPNPQIAELVTCLSKYVGVRVAEFEGIMWCDIDGLDDYLSLYYGSRKKILRYLKEKELPGFKIS